MLEAQLLQESTVDATNTGGPAFPGPYINDKGGLEAVWKQGGMTLRDYFAARAMEGLVAGAKHDEAINLHGAAEWSYNMADAMLKARAA